MKKKSSVKETLWTLDPAQTNLVVTRVQNKKGQLRFMEYKDTHKILGFVVVDGGRGAPLVQHLYEKTLLLQPAGGKDANMRYMFHTYEVGERLSGHSPAEDPEGVTLAYIAAMALGFLQQRTKSVQFARKRGLARDIEAFKAYAEKVGIKLPEDAKKRRPRVRRK